jgi:hypothetical protein
LRALRIGEQALADSSQGRAGEAKNGGIHARAPFFEPFDPDLFRKCDHAQGIEAN